MPQSQPILSQSQISVAAPSDELAKHRGHWIAYSPDGTRMIAGCATLAALEVQVRAAGENPEDVLLERVPEGEFIASGSELS